jgi:hypothetical protein
MRGIVISALALALSASAADAFSIRVHVYGANLVQKDAQDGEVDLGMWGKYRLDPAVEAALKAWPSYFRAGSVGPDGYPDIFTGQAFTHGDQSHGLVQHYIDTQEITCQRAINEGWCGECKAEMCLSPRDPLVPFRIVNLAGDRITRPQRYWRSIDWAHALLDDARREVRDASTKGIEEKQAASQALAFSFGYLMHYAGDGFAHQWVNLYAEGAWDYLDESLAPEYRHVTLERYIEYIMEPKVSDRVAWNTRKVDVPVWFVKKYLMEKYIGGCTVKLVGTPPNLTPQLACKDDSAASKAAHIRFLFGYREALESLLGQLPAPPDSGLTPTDPAASFSVTDPSSYSSVWSYMVNRCIYELAAGGFAQQGNCMERIYLMAFHTYVKNRLAATNTAIDQWIVTSNKIVQELLDNGIAVTAIKAHLTNYEMTYLRPMFIPGPNEPLRQWFGISCADAGPANFRTVCEAMMEEVRRIFGEVQDQVEEAFRKRMASWIEAYDRYLCALDKLVQYYTQPPMMMDYVFCGTPSQCARSQARKDQAQQDILSAGVSDEFMPFKNMVTMMKLALVGDQKRDMTTFVVTTNKLRGVTIDPTVVAFVNDDAYERILFESIATLDGSHPIEENVPAKGGVHNPDRIVYDQFRKPPRSGLLLDSTLKHEVYEPLFEVKRQDPDGDQIILAYDLCPCAPEVLASNLLDDDGDRVGDTCDPETNDLRIASIIASMPGTDFDSQQTRDKLADAFEDLFHTCNTKTTADAMSASGMLVQKIDAMRANKEISVDGAGLLYDEAKKMATLFKNRAMSCADNKLPKVVTSCP